MALPKIKKQIEARVKDTGDSMSGGLEIKNTGPMFTMTNSTSGQDMRLYPASNSTILLNRNVAGDSTNYRALYLHNSTASSSINSALVLQDTISGTANNYNLLHAGNYNNYVPTKGGTGATGVWNIDISGSSNIANYIIRQDTRDINEAPIDMLNGLSIHLKGSNDGLNDGGIYHAAIHIKDWQDYSGGPFGQMAITGNSNFWFRVSTSGTAWGAWKKVLDSSNYTSYTVTKTGSGASGTWGISISGNAAKDGSGNVITSTYLPLDGGTMKGSIAWPSSYNKTCLSFRPSSDTYTATLNYDYGGTECLFLNFKNSQTAFKIITGTNLDGFTNNQITSDTTIPAFMVKNNNVYTSGAYFSASGISDNGGSMSIIPQHSNEINFDGSGAGDTIYIGYRAGSSKPIPSTFVFGGSAGTSAIKFTTYYDKNVRGYSLSKTSSAPSNTDMVWAW